LSKKSSSKNIETNFLIAVNDGYSMWYLYATIGLAAICLGIPIFLIYWTDKKKKIAYDKKNKKSDDMKDLNHY
tara:strand:+ start:185 stop:403 length:219 start_codon:yes stop_codon:yes gene_type:complete